MFRTVLVANRGEIACRIMRTLRNMGIYSAAIFSDADRHAAHVRAADVALHVGPAAPAESYLHIERILQACARAGAAAIHPGYGFLAENSAFSLACERHGITFIGPGAQAMRAIGNKHLAKRQMQEAGIAVLPGYHGDAQDMATLEDQALRLGLPLMVKCSAGGGGKGMQVVTLPQQLRPALESARRLGLTAFADGTLLLERFLPNPRHIEVQILADRYGHIRCVGDRDCSLQRRHQKVIEEAPAAGLDDAMRRALHTAAVTVARAADYVNAGTVEFLVQGNDYYFLEVNTRLQVEHPITEAIAGIDLVEWQLRIAAGEALPAEAPSTSTGLHAVEARVCAEDPEQDFAPSSGLLVRCEWPRGLPGIRVDVGVERHDNVPYEYDSLLGKIIAVGDSRMAALGKLGHALRQTRIAGVRTNVQWLQRVLQGLELHATPVGTAFLANPDSPWRREVAPDSRVYVLGALALAQSGTSEAIDAHKSPWAARDAFTPGLQRDLHRTFYSPETTRVKLQRLPEGWCGTVKNHCVNVLWETTTDDRAEVTVDGLRQAFFWSNVGTTLHCWFDGSEYRLEYARPAAEQSHADSGHALLAAMPGTVVEVRVRAGDRVGAGSILVVLEAMKMEHSIIAPHDGTVTAVRVDVGDKARAGAVLVDLAGDTLDG
jgi:3-methylcrotonyl-CoA carboxylase alpha subunit